MVGLIGIKCGTTRWVNSDGTIEHATLIKIDSNHITAVMTQEKHGYSALQLASISVEKNINKPKKGLFDKLGISPQKKIKESRIPKEDESSYKVGDALSVDHFSNVASVSVSAKTKGRGFAGCVKRHNFSMQRATHGNSLSHRAPGAIGQCQFPGRVNKGKKMAGQMGDVQRTIKNLDVLNIDSEKGLLIIKGAVPGKPGAIVLVKEYRLAKVEAA